VFISQKSLQNVKRNYLSRQIFFALKTILVATFFIHSYRLRLIIISL